MPLFSIITITRNDAVGLQATRQSIKGQSWHDFEWLVVDGASTGATPQLLKKWSPEIAWQVSEPDSGIYDAMNKGMAAAKSEYLIFMNSGDAFANGDVLQQLAATIAENHEPDFIYGPSFEQLRDGTVRLKPCRSHRWHWWGMFAHHQSMIYRRGALTGLRYDDNMQVGGDNRLTYALLARAPRIAQVNFPIARCALPGVSTTHAAIGRNEQLTTKRLYARFPNWIAYLIWLAQASIWQFKKTVPNIYNRIRFKN